MGEFKKDDFFKIDPEPHLMGNLDHYNHFPGVQMWWRAAPNVKRALLLGLKPETFQVLEPHEMEKSTDPATSSTPWTNTAWTSPACYPNP